MTLVHADNHCLEDQDNVLNYSVDKLREIAKSCPKDQLSKLYYNRAYHKDLLDEGDSLSFLISYRNESIQQHVTTYRLYMALVETFARSRFPELEARAEFLNNVYDKYDEVASLRIRGYDRTADILEKAMLLKNN